MLQFHKVTILERFLARPSNSSVVVDSDAASISDWMTRPRGKHCDERHNCTAGRRKLKNIMLSLENFMVILETKDVFQTILACCHCVSSKMSTCHRKCDNASRLLQSSTSEGNSNPISSLSNLLTTASELFKTGEFGSSKNILMSEYSLARLVCRQTCSGRNGTYQHYAKLHSKRVNIFTRQ